MLELLQAEILIALQLLGCTSPAEVGRDRIGCRADYPALVKGVVASLRRRGRGARRSRAASAACRRRRLRPARRTAPLWVDYAGHDAPIVPKPGMVLAVSSGTGRAGADARGGRRDDPLRPQPQQPRRHDGDAGRPVDDRGEGEEAVRLRRRGHRLRDAADRRERALRRADADAVERDERAVPRERAAAPAGARRRSARRPRSRSRTRRTPAATPPTGGARPRRPRSSSARSTSPRRARKASTRSARRARAARCGRACAGSSRASPQIGIPAGRVALELQFQSAPGQGGAPGCSRRSAWLEFVKLEALAAKQVAAETKIEGVWSWGWPSFSVAGNDPDKPAAACVYLWARDPKLCDGPQLAGAGVQRVAHRGPDRRCRPACAARSARGTILKADVGRTARADRRPRLRGERAAAARRAARRAAVDPKTRARRRARDHPRPLRRQRRALPRRARAHAHSRCATRARSSPTGSRATASRRASGRSRRRRRRSPSS